MAMTTFKVKPAAAGRRPQMPRRLPRNGLAANMREHVRGEARHPRGVQPDTAKGVFQRIGTVLNFV